MKSSHLAIWDVARFPRRKTEVSFGVGFGPGETVGGNFKEEKRPAAAATPIAMRVLDQKFPPSIFDMLQNC